MNPARNKTKRRVFLVDDERVLRDRLQESLEHQGYRVEVAEDGAEGVTPIMISGFGEALADAEAMRPLGVSCVLQKPFDAKELFSAVRAALDAR